MGNLISKSGLFFSSVLILSACSAPKAPEQKAPPPVPVSVYQVTKQAAMYFDNYPATITPLNQVDLKAQVTGYITGIYFKDGQHVSKGEKLYDIDRLQYQANYDQAVANLNVAKASLANQRRSSKVVLAPFDIIKSKSGSY